MIDLQIVKTLPPEQQKQLLPLIEELQQARERETARASFLAFARKMWPPFIAGRHHKVMADAYDRIIDGSLKRLIINMAPRFTKSIFSSWLLPSKYLGEYPDRKIIQASHTAELAVGFGRQVRNLVASREYRDVYPGVVLSADSKAAGRWTTSKGGEYYAIGTGGNIAGRGADLLIIDDPHSEQQVISGDPRVFDSAYDWYTSGPRQRLQPNGAIVVCMTRWATRDLTGRLVRAMTSRDGVDRWEIIEFPAILPSGNALWPEYWSLEEMLALKAELPAAKWQAQYQQNPTSEEGALVKREWWQIWQQDKPPQCQFVIQAWDTAFLRTQRSDYSACTTWGVFYLPDDKGKQRANVMLLDAYRARLEFPQLKQRAYEMWKQRQPDAFIVEGKASGMPLIFELRAMGIPVSDFTPHRGSKDNPNDKIARVNGITDLFSSGMVWCPQTRWAEEVMDEFAAFPGDYDDYVDSGTMALYRFRQGGFLRLQTDDYDDKPMRKRKAAYY